MAEGGAKPLLVARLFANHGAALQAFFRRRVRSKADASDLAQEVYLRMLRVGNPEAIRNPMHYLFTVASNLAKEHAVLEQRDARGINIEDASAQAQLGTIPAFDSDLDAMTRAARLSEVLQQLRPKCRAAIELRFIRGMAYRDIATHLQISTPMVKKYLAQGLAHCRRRMARLG